MKVTVLYTIDSNANEWSEWEIELTARESLAYWIAVKQKKSLEELRKLDSVLARAEAEITAHEGLETAPRVTFYDPNYKVDPPNIELSSFIHILDDRHKYVMNAIREYHEEEKRNPTLELNLSGVTVCLEIKKYALSTKEAWDTQWCDCDFSFASGAWLHYHRENTPIILSCEVEHLADLLKNALCGNISEKSWVTLIEPDFEFVFYPSQDEYMEWKVNFWCTDGSLSDNYLSVTLYRADMEKLLEYLNRIMANGKETV